MEKTGFTKIGMLFRLALLVCLSCAMLSAKAQTARVTLDLKEVTLAQAMNEIKKQTRYLFINRDVEDINGRKVSINVSNELISNVLNRIFTPLGIDYYIDGKSIIISKRRQSDSKPVQVSGSVTDTNGQPVIGASVIVKGTTLGVSTDAEGMFSLQVPPPHCDRSIGNQLFGLRACGGIRGQSHFFRYYARRVRSRNRIGRGHCSWY